MKYHSNRNKKGQFAKQTQFTRFIEITWIALFWCAVIILMEKIKWIGAKDLFSYSLLMMLFWAGVIIIGEVFKYIAAKRLYRLFPWLNKLVNMESKK